MNTVIAYPTTANQITLLETLLKELKIRFAIKKTNETDPTLYSKDAYFAMIDGRVQNIEQGKSELIEYTPELEKELFAEIL
ncbi:MAG: hypothetical protein LBN95_05315 [Prevotellaceae bacterium]|jgi:hypothetical protein|nr:hypothetical protein [Prevotellaceae bacterium]